MLFTASDLASITRPTHNWVLFLVWLCFFILSGVISLLISSSRLGTYRPGENLFQCPIILPSYTVHVALKARILKWFASPFSSGPHCQSSPPWPVRLGWPHAAWLSFTELDTAVVLWSDWLVSVIMVLVCLPSDALPQHLPSYLGFSYLGRGISLHGCSSKVQPLLLTLEEGYLLTAAPPDLERWIAPLGPPLLVYYI